MIKKSKLIGQLIKLQRKIYIWENINVSINSSILEKEIAAKAFLHNNPTFTSYEICKTIKLSRPTFHNYLYRRVEKTWFQIKEEKETEAIKRIFNEGRRLYGQERIQILLKREGINISTTKISDIMKKNNLSRIAVIKRPERQAVRCGSYNRRKDLLRRKFNQEAPNKVWASDFLEIKKDGVKFYLCVVLDLYARVVVAWRLSHKQSENLAINTFKDAFEVRNSPMGLVFHTDQGGEFTSNTFRKTLKMLGVTQSFSRPGYPRDNAVMESFYSMLRREEINVHIGLYKNSRVIEEYLESYIFFYNNTRIHTSLGYIPPTQKEKEYYLSKNNQ